MDGRMDGGAKGRTDGRTEGGTDGRTGERTQNVLISQGVSGEMPISVLVAYKILEKPCKTRCFGTILFCVI